MANHHRPCLVQQQSIHMKIGIIGAGFIGRSVAQLALAAGHEVMLSNSRGPKSLSSVMSNLPGSQVGTVEQAAQFGDLVLLAIPFEHYRSIAARWLEGKTVLDANNYYPERDGHIAALDRFETTTSRLLAEHLCGARVVKVFNAILAQDLLQDGRPRGAADRRALPIAADDAQAAQQVIKLLDELGFDAVDAGNLDDSWRFERAKPAYCRPFDQAGLKQALAAAERQVELPHGSWRH
nr:NAD(P)-binding domain-containing protein [Pseudomonas baltica]